MPLGQAVTDHRIDGSEVITTGPSDVIEERPNVPS